VTTIGPDNITSDEWLSLDLSTQPKSALTLGGIKRSRSQSVSVQAVFYRAGRYTVRDQNGFTFRARRSELSNSKADKAARAARQGEVS
jgi:hypothetical protein